MRLWDRAAAVLDAIVTAVAFSESNDFTTDIMATMDATLVKSNALSNVTTMEERIQHEASSVKDNAFMKDFSALFSAFDFWYVSGTETGFPRYASLNAALTGRAYRVPKMISDALSAERGLNLSAINVSLTDELTMYTCTKGASDTLTEGDAVPSGMTAVPIAIEANGDIALVDLDMSIDVTYADATEGTETEQIPNTYTDGDQLVAFSNDNTGDGALSGESVLPMSATAGMVAGQVILVQDCTWPVKLTSDCTTSATVVVEDTSPYDPGDDIYLHDDDTANEEATIESINRETNTITLTAACAGAFTTAQSAYIRKKTADDYGWCEIATIDTVNSNTSLELVAALKHTYSSEGFAQRLVASIDAVTLSNGTNGDSVYILGIPDRPGYAALLNA
jgi:hypothetical protein